ncbi:MAG: hypothetical protein HYZ23_00385 [Chloroflexi bacterium]|nr:hypothetical protein [Chloroflexota bacterium]
MWKRILPVLPILVFAACAPDISDPNIQAAVIHSLTATVWTPTPPTPSATPESDTARIVDVLNDAMSGADPLAETVNAKFIVTDAQVIVDENTRQASILRIHVDCEWVFSDSCTTEAVFVALMHAFSANDKVIERITKQLPPTINILETVAFDRMKQNGVIVAAWQDVLDFVSGRINGNQLGARIIHAASEP